MMISQNVTLCHVNRACYGVINPAVFPSSLVFSLSIPFPHWPQTLPMSTIGILGGGISGLSAAYYLARFGPSSNKVVLIEGSKRVGGWVRSQRVGPGFYPSPATASTRNKEQDGIVFEGGPRSLRPVGVSGAIMLDMVS